MGSTRRPSLAGDLSRDRAKIRAQSPFQNCCDEPAETLLTDRTEQVGSIIQWYESLDKYPVTEVDVKAKIGPGSSSSKEIGRDVKDRAV